jgi:hypothetical protein
MRMYEEFVGHRTVAIVALLAMPVAPAFASELSVGQGPAQFQALSGLARHAPRRARCDDGRRACCRRGNRVLLNCLHQRGQDPASERERPQLQHAPEQCGVRAPAQLPCRTVRRPRHQRSLLKTSRERPCGSSGFDRSAIPGRGVRVARRVLAARPFLLMEAYSLRSSTRLAWVIPPR